MTTVLLWIFIIAFMIGIIASILGIGGGALNVPVLVLIFSFDQMSAVGTSLLINVATTFTAMTSYAFQGRILYRTALLFAGPALIFSALSVFLSTYLTNAALTLVFICILLLLGVMMIRPDIISVPEISRGPVYTDGCNDKYGKKFRQTFHSLHMLVWGGTGGLMTGFTGLGGGVVNVPAMVSAKIPTHYATATSTLVVFIACCTASVVHMNLGSLPSAWFLLAYLAGAVGGAFTGSRYAHRLKSAQLSFVFGVFLFIVCGIMIVHLAL